MVKLDLTQVNNVFRKKEHEYQEDVPEEEDVDASEFEDDDYVPVKTKNRRPKEDNFTQQRLASINPVFTPKSVLPIYLLVAVVFVIVGGCLLAQSSRVDEITMFYQDCVTAAPKDNFQDMPDDHFNYIFHNHKDFNTKPQWRFVDDPSDDSNERGTCQIRFTTPADLKKTVYVNYVLEKFAANHRRYVLSFSEDQIRGKRPSLHDVRSNTGINCKVLGHDSEGKLIYPCGLIANSMFNDSYPFELQNVQDSNKNYPLTNKRINWHSDKKRYKKTKYNHTEVVPPPYWAKAFPNGYNETNMPNINEWEEFQNWMRPAAFDKQTKLIRKNTNDTLPAGEWQIDIGLHWPVTEYNGKKGVFITHGSSIGGRNPFLGEVYLIGGCICAAMAIVLALAWVMGGRKIADPTALSWNKDDSFRLK
ncbi:hypothetical protein B1J91_D02442g [Nakaseomyces glabratus]|nr:hypothetical protein B1J91_D02442g [Nakaseomyces glabratus]